MKACVSIIMMQTNQCTSRQFQTKYKFSLKNVVSIPVTGLHP